MAGVALISEHDHIARQPRSQVAVSRRSTHLSTSCILQQASVFVPSLFHELMSLPACSKRSIAERGIPTNGEHMANSRRAIEAYPSAVIMVDDRAIHASWLALSRPRTATFHLFRLSGISRSRWSRRKPHDDILECSRTGTFGLLAGDRGTERVLPPARSQLLDE